MNSIGKVAFCLAALAGVSFVPPATAQTLITPTTLSVAIDSKQTVMTVASATGIVAPANPTAPGLAPAGTACVIDNHELVDVRAVSGTTITIRRGAGGSTAAAHAKSALVFCSSPQNIKALKVESEMAGSCTRGTFPADVLPKLNIVTGVISDCLGGSWVNGVNTPWPKFQLSFPEPGGTAYTSLNTNGTTTVAGTTYCTEVNLPANKNLTGIAVLNGTTAGGTDKRISILYDAAGNLLANSATAGAASASASTYQTFAFTSKYFAVGPAQYFACIQANGVTDTIRMVVTGTQDQLLTKSFTGTFGTLTALTVPTTFTTAVGPYVVLY